MNHDSKGSTLIIVIWFIAIIGIVVSFLFYRTEAEWASVVNAEKQQTLAEVAETVLHEKLALLINDKTDSDSAKDSWYQEGQGEQELDGCQITVITEDEGSKPNLNTISDKAIQQIMRDSANRDSSNQLSQGTTTGKPAPDPQKGPSESGEDAKEAQVSIDPLLDWRDRDDELKPEGAELSYYQGLNPPYKPRNGCFSSLEEIKQVKGGGQLYQALAPEVTLLGRVNPNTIDGETFVNLLNSYGEFDKLDTIKDQFTSFRRDNRFEDMDSFVGINAIGILERDKIKPLFQFSGRCNINLATKTGLAVTLKEAGYTNEALLTTIIGKRKTDPYEQISDLYGPMRYNPNRKGVEKKALPDDYFTVTSTIIRYRIWVVKGNSRYYLDMVWERQYSGLKKEWQISRLLYRRELWNDQAPEIPKTEEVKDNEKDDKAAHDEGQ